MKYFPHDNDVPPRRRREAFTFLEALIAVALLAILAAILLPLFNTTIAISDRTKCLNHLRQMGVAVINYAGDHGGLLPGPTFGSQHASYRSGEVRKSDNPLDSKPLIAFIVPYLELPSSPPDSTVYFPEIAECPAAKKAILAKEGVITRSNAYYFLTHESVDSDGIRQRPFGYNTSTTAVPVPPMKLVSVVRPHLVIGLSDNDAATHHGRVNLLFIDGRVRSVKETEIIYPGFPSKARIRIDR